MLTRRDATVQAGERPFNNLLRRLNDADFALVAPHLSTADAKPGELLYSPGDDVETVHFPCGPSLASYMVPNEDGRDVETILIGREGAVAESSARAFCLPIPASWSSSQARSCGCRLESSTRQKRNRAR